MGFLSRLFVKSPPPPSPLEEVRRLIERFSIATLAGVDAEDIGRYPPKQRKVMAFHFGAIAWLAERYALDETETLAVFVMFLDKYFNMPVRETGSISQLLEGFQASATEQEYLAAGREVFRRWHEHNERRAPLTLGEMLQRR
jgi:hypothetical protein